MILESNKYFDLTTPLHLHYWSKTRQVKSS